MDERVLRELIADARSAREAAQIDFTAAADRLAMLRDEENALLAVLNRRLAEQGKPSEVREGMITSGWTTLPRSGAVRQALIEVFDRSCKPVSPAQIETYLSERNRIESRDEISTTLSYLRGSGLAERVGRGEWIPVDQTPQPAEPPPGSAWLTATSRGRE
ncbi:MAG TPA: hypothetical protein VK816_02310 [Jatrophihabitantaceae bacterium]|jgi:hypothetical protein|nr:hypothetical protein [Jatrophihabitantaceae bacterium]